MLEARVVGYAGIESDVLEAACNHHTDTCIIVSVDHVLYCEFDDPPSSGEQKLIDLCKQAKSLGIRDLILYEE